jgi:hypothetical protein
MRRLIPLVLASSLLLAGGCRGTRVNIMGWEPGRPIQAADQMELTGEEKAGALLIVGLAIALAVVGASVSN